MSESKYELLINEATLYPPEFVLKHGINTPHWEIEGWQRRERSLLHDMLCILLSNLEPSDNLEERMLNSLKRKAEDNEEDLGRKS